MCDESGTVFIHQDQTSELHRLARLAAFVQLRVRLEHTEELLFVGHAFLLQHPAASRVLHAFRAGNKGSQGVLAEDVVFAGGGQTEFDEQGAGSADDIACGIRW